MLRLEQMTLLSSDSVPLRPPGGSTALKNSESRTLRTQRVSDGRRKWRRQCSFCRSLTAVPWFSSRFTLYPSCLCAAGCVRSGSVDMSGDRWSRGPGVGEPGGRGWSVSWWWRCSHNNTVLQVRRTVSQHRDRYTNLSVCLSISLSSTIYPPSLSVTFSRCISPCISLSLSLHISLSLPQSSFLLSISLMCSLSSLSFFDSRPACNNNKNYNNWCSLLTSQL